MAIKAVIFDMDGVLIDSELGYNHAEEAYLKQFGIPFGPDKIAALTGANGRVVGELIRGWNPSLTQSADELGEGYIASLFESLKTSVRALIPGVDMWLGRLREAGMKMAIASSSSREMVDSVTYRLDLVGRMDAIVTGSDVTRGKPWPEIYLKAAELIGVDPDLCIAIEDAPNGIRAAHAAGMRCIAFHGTNRHGLDLSEGDWSMDVFDEQSLQKVLDEN